MATREIDAVQAAEPAAPGTAAESGGDTRTGESEVVRARFPLRLLRPAAWRLRAPHRITAATARRSLHRVS